MIPAQEIPSGLLLFVVRSLVATSERSAVFPASNRHVWGCHPLKPELPPQKPGDSRLHFAWGRQPTCNCPKPIFWPFTFPWLIVFWSWLQKWFTFSFWVLYKRQLRPEPLTPPGKTKSPLGRSRSFWEVPLNDTLSLNLCQVPGAADRFLEMMRRPAQSAEQSAERSQPLLLAPPEKLGLKPKRLAFIGGIESCQFLEPD